MTFQKFFSNSLQKGFTNLEKNKKIVSSIRSSKWFFWHLQTSLDRSRKFSYYKLVVREVKKLREEIRNKENKN